MSRFGDKLPMQFRLGRMIIPFQNYPAYDIAF